MRGMVAEGTVTTFAGSTGLLQALLNWLAGPASSLGWTVKYIRNSREGDKVVQGEPWGSDCQECILHNTGLSGLENVLIGIREWKYAAGASNAWDLNGYTTFIDDQFWNISGDQHLRTPYDTAWEHFTQLPVLPLIDDTMYYWFFADEQRIIVVAKVQSNYESCYLGFGDRFGSPTDYPYPLIIKGSSFGNLAFSSTSNNHHSMVDNIKGNNSSIIIYSSLVVKPDNSWGVPTPNTLDIKFHPMRDWMATGIIAETPTLKQVLVSPVTVIDQASQAVLSEMDQVIHIGGVGVQSEDEIEGPNGLTYKIFQNVFRTEYNDFFGVAISDT